MTIRDTGSVIHLPPIVHPNTVPNTPNITTIRRPKGHRAVPNPTSLPTPTSMSKGNNNNPDLPPDISNTNNGVTQNDFGKSGLPQLIKKTIPEYPDISKTMGQEGSVTILCHVDVNGNVSHVSLHKSSGYDLLDKAALNAAESCLFIPAYQNGEPIALDIYLVYKFKLSGNIEITDE